MTAAFLPPLPSPATDRVTIIGLEQLARVACAGSDLTPVWNTLAARVEKDPTDAAALMDLSTILMLSGQRERGLRIQEAAIDLSPLYRRPHGRADGLRLLAFVAAGDLMANTPLDFLLHGSDVELHLLYVAADRPLPTELPAHDLAMLAIAESDANRPILDALETALARWPHPVLNGAPGRIAALSREGLCVTFADDPNVVVPRSVPVARAALEAIRDGATDVAALLPGAGFPVVVRPLDSHAGTGLRKLSEPAEFTGYLGEWKDEAFYIAPFIDYRSADGLFRKQRIVFVRGRPFASHLAVSERWMVHYLNAGMGENAAKRAEEAHFMATFETEFAARHQAAFAALHGRIGLDYFAIDSAEMPDGRLLVFEADVAMIVHDLDSEGLYPYKKPAMARLFAGFVAGLEEMAAAGGHHGGAKGTA